MKNNIRNILFYDFEIKSSKQDANVASLREIVDVLYIIANEDRGEFKIQKETESLELRDVIICEDSNTATLLITHTDPSQANAVYSSYPKTKKRQTRVLCASSYIYGQMLA